MLLAIISKLNAYYSFFFFFFLSGFFKTHWNFPGSRVVKTLNFHYTNSTSDQGSKIMCAVRCG